ncbi:MAG: DUF6527 family protein [Thermoplasmata archaeon]
MKLTSIRPEFVEFIPERLEAGIVYISIPYATATHKCACGCGEPVVTPIRPTDWSLTWDGETVTLYPSIGNWSLPCQSHYWIRENRIVWARSWSQWEIDAGRAADAGAKARRYGRSQKKRARIPAKSPP